MESSTGIAFLGFTEKDRQYLLEAYVCIRSSIPSIMDEFYRSLDVIGEGPKNYGVEPENLAALQAAHWRHLFNGRFDRDYDNAARRIAIRHYEIGLPQDLYAMSYMKVLVLFHEAIWKAPGIERAHARMLTEAVTKAIAIDMVHAISPYSGDLV
jgi:Protoglobin